MADSLFDVVVIGGGILGLSIARQLLRERPELRLAILEKEPTLAAHQTGHNSGVIHAGIYYRPGSLKAKFCVEGKLQLLQFCDEHEIPVDGCGKVIIATQPQDLPRLAELERRGRANGVDQLELIGPERLAEIEPHAQGIKALYSPTTCIVDYKRVAAEYAKEVEALGGVVMTCRPLTNIEKRSGSVILQTPLGDVRSRFLLNCAGVYADRIAVMAGQRLPYQIIPFRGEYYGLTSEASRLLKGLIYPVANPAFPFLGVHLTRTIAGEVEAGPNAVLALSREAYRRGQFSMRDCWDLLRYPGFWKMAGRYWKVGCYELYRSWRRKVFLRDLQRLMPILQESDLVPGGAGIRAQVVLRNGTMCDDFALLESSWSLHLLNAPSPGATASLMIGSHLAAMALKSLDQLAK
jgi:(S)-2-hydroxyglutarate dehydrogenase